MNMADIDNDLKPQDGDFDDGESVDETELYRKYMESTESPDPASVPDYGEIEEKANRLKSRFSSINYIVGKPVVFTNVTICPRKSENRRWHKCLVSCMIIESKKKYAFYTCSDVLARQFFDIYHVLYNTSPSRRRQTTIDRPFKGVVNRIGSMAVKNEGKTMTYYKISTTLHEEVNADECGKAVQEAIEAKAQC